MRIMCEFDFKSIKKALTDKEMIEFKKVIKLFHKYDKLDLIFYIFEVYMKKNNINEMLKNLEKNEMIKNT